MAKSRVPVATTCINLTLTIATTTTTATLNIVFSASYGILCHS